MTNPESLIYWSDESQLMGYGESDSSGCWLKFQITPEDLEKFRGLKGTVFHHTLVKIQDNGEPEKQKEEPYSDKPIGPLCREALDAAENTMWWLYLETCLRPGIQPVANMTSYYAGKAIKSICKVETRKAFDYDEQAGERWKDLRKNYLKWNTERAAGKKESIGHYPFGGDN